MKNEINIEKEEIIIRNQLVRLDKQYNSLKIIGALISIITVLSMSFQLELIYYWIPASFLLMFLWLLISFRNVRKKSLTVEKAKKSIQLVDKYNQKTWLYGATLFIKNINAILKAITVIYLFNIVIILFHMADKITLPFHGTIELFFISLISIYFVFGVFFVDKFPKYFSTDVIKSIKKLDKIQLNTKIPEFIRKHALKFIIALAILFFIFVIIIPLWIFITVISYVGNVWFLIVVMLLQVLIIILLYSFFSHQQVKSELDKSLNNIIKIKDGELNEDLILVFVQFTRYSIDDSLKFFQFYIFRPHPIYLRHIKQEKHKRKI